MKIYVAHSSKMNYEEKLYNPIRESKLFLENDFVFPHIIGNIYNTKDIIKSCDLVIAEVSEASIGLGIELGWADAYNIPILCIYENGKKYSTALEFVTNNFIQYTDKENMICEIEKFIKIF